MARMWWCLGALLASLAVLSAGASADLSSEGQARRGVLEGAASRSLGWPFRGHLVGGLELTESRLIRFTSSDREGGRFWGTVELVKMIERAVAQVDRQLPGARLTVGELSQKRGGNVVGHRSHENGRDADLGFYFHDEAGNPVSTPNFINVWRSGRGKLGEQVVRFDVQRNWLLIEAMISDPEVPLQHVFTAPSIRRRLLRTARRLRVPQVTYERAEYIIMPARVHHPHRNHFHVRIYCPENDIPGCRDRGPYWPWLPDSHSFAALATPLPFGRGTR